jgi:hypothetical protein
VSKLERVLDGWTVVGERLVCALCQEPLSADGSLISAQSDERAGLDALSSLLGESPAEKPEMADDGGAHFCKDCIHFLRHPFVSRCLFHDRPTEPMDDCEDFSPRPAESQDGETNA